MFGELWGDEAYYLLGHRAGLNRGSLTGNSSAALKQHGLKDTLLFVRATILKLSQKPTDYANVFTEIFLRETITIQSGMIIVFARSKTVKIILLESWKQ